MKGIYVIKKDGDPVYVGRSGNIYSRWAAHLTNYPYADYDYEVLEITNDNKREQYWIEKMNTLLEGNNQCNAVATKPFRPRKYAEDLQLPFEAYQRGRVIWLYQTFDGASCNSCGDPTARYLQWHPFWKEIKHALLRHGRKTPQYGKGLALIDECNAVCQNCVTDKEWGESLAP